MLSLLFFRSLVASFLPVLLGGLSIVTTFFVLRLVSSFVDLSVFSLNFVTGLGLEIAINYSLFMVSGPREEAVTCGVGLETLRRTLQTRRDRSSLQLVDGRRSGRLAPPMFPQRFLYSMGIAGAFSALVAATLALVRAAGAADPYSARASTRSHRNGCNARPTATLAPPQSGAWYRLSRLVMRRPGQIAIVCAAFLIALGTPFIGIKFVSVTASVLRDQRERATGQRHAHP